MFMKILDKMSPQPESLCIFVFSDAEISFSLQEARTQPWKTIENHFFKIPLKVMLNSRVVGEAIGPWYLGHELKG